MSNRHEIDFDAAQLLKLDEQAFNNAIDAATEAHAAGDDAQGQMEAGIKAYLQTLIQFPV